MGFWNWREATLTGCQRQWKQQTRRRKNNEVRIRGVSLQRLHPNKDVLQRSHLNTCQASCGLLRVFKSHMSLSLLQDCPSDAWAPLPQNPPMQLIAASTQLLCIFGKCCKLYKMSHIINVIYIYIIYIYICSGLSPLALPVTVANEGL